ncbi:MAG: tetratricopeptide repeat protein [Planctomycetes bacterium]|nr:tetratricopeptide repeat protein [Planctomycetota bacterium]
MTESGSSSQSPKPNLPGGAKKEDRPDFKVIRSAPAPESGPNLMPVLLLVGVLALGVGGYVVTQRKGADADPKGTPKTTTETATPAGPPAPDFVMEKIGFYENEGRLAQALTYAQEKLVDYPGAPNLRAKIRELRGKLGQDVVTNPEDALRQAAARIQAGQLQEALDGLDGLLSEQTLSDPQRARASFLLAMAHGGLGNSLDARNALETAASLGHDAGEVARLREKLGL